MSIDDPEDLAASRAAGRVVETLREPARRARRRSGRPTLTDGLVITVEPIIASGSGEVYVADGWTVRTDHHRSALPGASSRWSTAASTVLRLALRRS